MVGAVSHPFVDILGHPRGRRYDVRPGVSADWREVFAAAAERGVAIEIDGYPDRQDVDWTLAAAALDAGCLFALDSDAHATEELLFSRMAVAHARLAGIPPERVINCWSDERLEEWMNRPERTTVRSTAGPLTPKSCALPPAPLTLERSQAGLHGRERLVTLTRVSGYVLAAVIAHRPSASRPRRRGASPHPSASRGGSCN